MGVAGGRTEAVRVWGRVAGRVSGFRGFSGRGGGTEGGTGWGEAGERLRQGFRVSIGVVVRVSGRVSGLRVVSGGGEAVRVSITVAVEMSGFRVPRRGGGEEAVRVSITVAVEISQASGFRDGGGGGRGGQGVERGLRSEGWLVRVAVRLQAPVKGNRSRVCR